MATKNPLAIYGGDIKQIQVGDTIPRAALPSQSRIINVKLPATGNYPGFYVAEAAGIVITGAYAVNSGGTNVVGNIRVNGTKIAADRTVTTSDSQTGLNVSAAAGAFVDLGITSVSGSVDYSSWTITYTAN